MTIERRRVPRIEVRRRVHVEVEGFKGHLTLLNVSPGGFGVSTNELLAGNEDKVVRFAARDGRWVLTLAARVAHVGVHNDQESGADTYFAGLAFVDAGTPAVSRVVDELLERVAGVLV
jgi:hypothetical protein